MRSYYTPTALKLRSFMLTFSAFNRSLIARVPNVIKLHYSAPVALNERKISS